MTREEYIVRPQHFLRYLREVERLRASQTRLPSRLVLVFGGHDLQAFRRAFRARPRAWYRWLYVGRAGKRPAAVVRAPVGAPGTVLAMEELAVLGVRDVIALGACGSLVSDLPIGSIIVPDRAYSDEGTSRHYGGPRWTRPSSRLAEALRSACERHAVPCHQGGVWTTDAPYRESRSKARALAGKGVVAVDMEASAIYTVARRLGLRAASLFVVSDELGGDDWNAGFRHPAFLRGKRRAVLAVADAMSRSAP